MVRAEHGRVVTVLPAWLRPVAWGCAILVMVLTAGLVWSTCSLQQVLSERLGRMRARVLAALPADTPDVTREALAARLECVVQGASRRAASQQALRDLVAACNEGLADGTLSEIEVARILAAAERACRAAEAGP